MESVLQLNQHDQTVEPASQPAEKAVYNPPALFKLGDAIELTLGGGQCDTADKRRFYY